MPPTRPIIVGITARTAPTVAVTALDFAHKLDASIVFISVDAARFPSVTNDGQELGVSFDSDSADYSIVEEFDADVKDTITAQARRRHIHVDFRAIAGKPVDAIIDLADEVDASMIVLGSPEETGLGKALGGLSRSVATHLAHRQHRPILIVPTLPGGSAA